VRDDPNLLDVTLFEGGPNLSTKCPFCIKNGIDPEDGTDSVEHIMNICPSTEAQRNRRRCAIVSKLKGLASANELLAIADSALSHPDAHAGSVSIQTRDLVRKCLEQNKKWKYKTGCIQGVLLASTTALFTERTDLLKDADDPPDLDNPPDTDDNDYNMELNPSGAPAQPPQGNPNNMAQTHNIGAFADKLNGRHQRRTDTQLKLKRTNRAVQRKSQGNTQVRHTHKKPRGSPQRNPQTSPNKPVGNTDRAGPSEQAPPKRPRTREETTTANNKPTKKTSATIEQIPWTPARSSELARAYRTVGLEDLDNVGDGNCLLYAAMGIDGRHKNHPKWAKIYRDRAITHASSLPPHAQEYLGLARSNPTGNTEWTIAYQAEDKAWMNNNMIHSVATALQIDIAVATHLRTGSGVRQTLDIYRAGPPVGTILAPTDDQLLFKGASCQWSLPPEHTVTPGEGAAPRKRQRPLRQLALNTLLKSIRQTNSGPIYLRVIHSNIGTHYRGTKQYTPDQHPQPT
jgi:hypothetical protein